MASISVNTSWHGQQARPSGPWSVPPYRHFIQIAGHALLQAHWQDQRTRRPITACRTAPIVPALRMADEDGSLAARQVESIGALQDNVAFFQVIHDIEDGLTLLQTPLTITTSPGNPLWSGSIPISVVGRQGGRVIPRRNRLARTLGLADAGGNFLCHIAVIVPAISDCA